MKRLVVDVRNEKILDKLLWVLKHFEKDGVEIAEVGAEEEWEEEYLEKHWREIGMATHSAHLDDDEELYRACAEYYDEECSD